MTYTNQTKTDFKRPAAKESFIDWDVCSADYVNSLNLTFNILKQQFKMKTEFASIKSKEQPIPCRTTVKDGFIYTYLLLDKEFENSSCALLIKYEPKNQKIITDIPTRKLIEYGISNNCFEKLKKFKIDDINFAMKIGSIVDELDLDYKWLAIYMFCLKLFLLDIQKLYIGEYIIGHILREHSELYDRNKSYLENKFATVFVLLNNLVMKKIMSNKKEIMKEVNKDINYYTQVIFEKITHLEDKKNDFRNIPLANAYLYNIQHDPYQMNKMNKLSYNTIYNTIIDFLNFERVYTPKISQEENNLFTNSITKFAILETSSWFDCKNHKTTVEKLFKQAFGYRFIDDFFKHGTTMKNCLIKMRDNSVELIFYLVKNKKMCQLKLSYTDKATLIIDYDYKYQAERCSVKGIWGNDQLI